jgi:hypothetical protein
VFFALIASASAQSNFNRYTWNIGGGLGIGRDDVASYVGNSYHGVVGGGINFTRMFGADAEYMFYDLSFRPSASAGLQDQTGNMQSFSLDGIVHAPLHGRVGAYGIFGIGFYRRYVSANKQYLQVGTLCQPAWRWWDLNCYPNGVISTPQTLSSNAKDAGGFNYGGGVTYKWHHLHNSQLYAEFRYHRAYQSDGQTIVMPITLGLRW